MPSRNDDPTAMPGTFAGPGYSGFGGSAGYTGNTGGGITGGYSGSGHEVESWEPGPSTLHDDRIEQDVRERLATTRELGASRIEVAVSAGVVTLSGTVETRALKHLAADATRDVVGVVRVHNSLHVEKPLLEELREKLTSRHHEPQHR